MTENAWKILSMTMQTTWNNTGCIMQLACRIDQFSFPRLCKCWRALCSQSDHSGGVTESRFFFGTFPRKRLISAGLRKFFFCLRVKSQKRSIVAVSILSGHMRPIAGAYVTHRLELGSCCVWFRIVVIPLDFWKFWPWFFRWFCTISFSLSNLLASDFLVATNYD